MKHALLSIICLFLAGSVVFATETPDDPQAQCELGKKHKEGDGVEKNVDEAFRLFVLAAEAGNADSMDDVKKMLENLEKQEKSKSRRTSDRIPPSVDWSSIPHAEVPQAVSWE